MTDGSLSIGDVPLMSSGFTRRRLLALAGATSLSAALAGAVRAEGGVAAPVTVTATEAPFATTTPVRIGAAALRVRQLEPMTAWYRSALGLDLLGRGPDGVVLGVADVPLLTLIPAPDAMPDSPALAGLFHIAFLMPDRAALARRLVHAAALRLPLQGFADHSVSEAIYLADPEGNGLEVYADRPRQDWRWQDGVVTMGTYSLDIDSLLTLTLVTGVLFVDDLLAQKLVHKTVLSVLSWLAFGALLFGRWRYGWRGSMAVRWTLAAMMLLLLAFFGSKFVIELVLQRA